MSGNTVTLTWQAPGSGGVPTSYVVEVSLSPGGAVIVSIPVSSTTLAVPNVPTGVYSVRIRGVNADGTSEASPPVIVTVPNGAPQCSSVPGVPSNLAGGTTGSLVSLTWTPDFSTCPTIGYTVYVGSAPGLSNLAVVNVPSRMLSAVAPVGTYYVRVTAFNSRGHSFSSNEVVVHVTSDVTPLRFDALATVPNRSPFTTYAENGFEVTATGASWHVVTTYGNLAPSIQFRLPPSQPALVGEMRVTAGGARFVFTAVDLYSSVTPIPYEIVGTRGGTTVFRMSGTVPLTYGRFATLANIAGEALIDALVIRVTNSSIACCPENPMGIDNIAVARRP